MKVHDRPLVILLTRPSIDWDGVDTLLAEYGKDATWRRSKDSEGDSIPEMMGRLCYGSWGNRQGRIGAEAYLANILEGGHGSVLEHACWGFVVCRASRGFTHQMIRHRAGFAFSQESQHFIRYGAEDSTDGPEAACCTTGMPPGGAAVAVQACLEAVDRYEQLWKVIRAAFPPEMKAKKLTSGLARGVLPTMMESRLGFTANARALRHFCELRGSSENVEEVRIVACDVLSIMKHEAPAIFADMQIVLGEDLKPTVVSGHRKV